MSNQHNLRNDLDPGPEWATPSWIWEPLREALGGFDLDLASGCEPEPIARNRFQLPEKDGLKEPWFGHVWVNPPYGRKFNNDWSKKIVEESKRDEVDSITALLGASTSTKRWHRESKGPLKVADLFTFIDGRVSFIGAEKTGSFCSVILTFGVENTNEAYLQALDELGLVLKHARP